MGLLQYRTKVNDKILDFLSGYSVGAPGAFHYRHCETRNKVAAIKKPLFVTIERKNKIIGGVCFSERSLQLNGAAATASYIRYFYFLAQFRRSGSIEIQDSRPVGAIKKEAAELLDRGTYYAYVDLNNTRSATICQRFGFEKAGEFRVLVFSRLFPEKANIIQPTDERLVKMLLKSYYAKHNFFSFENFSFEKYYAITDQSGEIVAGVQCETAHWQILNIPGTAGRIIKGLKYLPFLTRLFSEDYRFLTFDYIYCRSGYESALSRLFEALLKKYNLHSGVICLDSRSPLYAGIKSGVRLGLLNSLKDEMVNHVIVKSNDLDPASLKNEPIFVSTYDIT